MAERLNNRLPQEKHQALWWAFPPCCPKELPCSPPPLQTPPGLHQWPWQLFRLQEGGSGCDKRGSKLLDLLPLPGLLLLSIGSTTSSDSPCSSPLSPPRASRLACVHLCGEECKTALLTTSPCYSATSTGALPPAQPSTLSPEPAAHQREVTRLQIPLIPGPEPQERQPTLQVQDRERKEQVLPWGTGETSAYPWE